MNRISIFWFVYALGVELTYTNATTTYRLLPIVSKDCQPQLIQGAERDAFLKNSRETRRGIVGGYGSVTAAVITALAEFRSGRHFRMLGRLAVCECLRAPAC